MQLHIAKYRISSDARCFTLEKRSTNKKGETYYVQPSYYPNLETTLVALLGRFISTGKKESSEEVLTAKELIAVIKEAKAEILAAVAAGPKEEVKAEEVKPVEEDAF